MKISIYCQHSNHHDLDNLLDKESFIKKYVEESDAAIKDETVRIRQRMLDRKGSLNKSLDNLRIEINLVEKELDKNIPRLERISTQKKLNVLQKELKNREQGLFMDDLRLEQEAESEINELLDKTNYIVDIKRHFVVEVRGNIK